MALTVDHWACRVAPPGVYPNIRDVTVSCVLSTVAQRGHAFTEYSRCLFSPGIIEGVVFPDYVGVVLEEPRLE